jgi:hypothetical protein
LKLRQLGKAFRNRSSRRVCVNFSAPVVVVVLVLPLVAAEPSVAVSSEVGSPGALIIR